MYDEFVEKLYTYTKFAKLGLENIQNLLKILDNPQNNFKSIHVAGTNGKGSVAAMVSQILMEEGYKTGLYISPHLVDFRERIQINRELISKDDLLRIGENIVNIVDSRNPASFFEITTAIMFKYFAEKKVDYA
ncbi:MAG: bifunctional folylpolyglutamate synthase/dihydrofolate synthase, partial [Methanomicrobia archaeon]|nr:bifunctional folylpolyglutamate synthase/dihydrofolate synthase [Methanomicrobia archaeon]